MPVADLLTQTCSIVRRTHSGVEDDYGNEIPGEIVTETVCELQQRQRGEKDEELSVTSYLLVVPAGTDIDTADAVIVDGTEYEVAGDPWPARDPLARSVSHIEVTVVRTSGAFDGDVS